ncbi:FecCD family ABC transporter permease [Halalkalibacter lacteus]|uniref:FecCD family ABC transporter permease n=1 Tax=Halalkalibacter lacteus TaxID=3090663 RepID=UPI002FC70D67
MLLQTKRAKVLGLLLGAVLFLLFICFSIVYGYTNTTWKTAIEAYTKFNGSNEHLIIQTVRMPRALIAAAVGASLGIAGALMQALTQNPLADPKIFGINAGASFFIVFAVSFFSITSLGMFIWIAFLGAAVAAITVYCIGSLGREGLTPMKFTLAGAAIWALFSSLTQGMLVLNEKALEEVLFWLAGSVQGRKLEYLQTVLPYMTIAWVGSLIIARHINLLSMGEDIAKGLGQKTGLIKLVTAVIIILLAGGSVAIAGPIGFVGIMVPHLARSFVGIDHRWLIPYCAIIGGCLLLLADISARYIIMPQEIPVGVMTAIIGTPFFIYIARKGLTKS